MHIVRRLLRQRLVSASIIIGLAVSIALGVAVPLATNALATLGLRSTLSALAPTSRNIQMSRALQPWSQEDQTEIREQLGPLLSDDYTISTTPQIGSTTEPELDLTVRLRHQEDWEQHVTINQAPLANGPAHRLPAGSCENGRRIPTMISAEQADKTSLQVGDELCILNNLILVIQGTFSPNDVDDPYWQFDRKTLRGEFASDSTGISIIPVLLIDKQAFAKITTDNFGGQAGIAAGFNFFDSRRNSYVYNAFTDTSSIQISTLADVADRLQRLRAEQDAGEPRPRIITGIDNAITTFNNRFRLLQSSLLILLLEIVVLAMLYVVVVGRLAMEQQSAELALLRSRGSSRWQLLVGQIGQSLILALPGLFLGVGLGVLAAAALSQTTIFRALRGGSFEVRFTPDIGITVSMIIVVAVAALLIAARPALAQSIVLQRREQARPVRTNDWRTIQRDVLLTVLAVAGWWQLRRAGTSLTPTVTGVTQLNILLLAAPALLLLAGSLLFLRIFPLLVRSIGALMNRNNGIVAALSAWQLARNPTLYGQLVLLLTLAVGLGVYTQTTMRTIGREQLRQAIDEAGADIRIPLSNTTISQAALAAYPVAASTSISTLAAEVTRGDAPQSTTSQPTTLVGVDGPALRSVLVQTGNQDNALLGTLQSISSASAQPPLGAPLPPGTDAVVATVIGPTTDITLYARIAAINGVRQISLGRPSAQPQQFRAAIPSDLQEPYTLQSFIVQPNEGKTGRAERGIIIGGIAAETGGRAEPMADTINLDAWEAVGGPHVELAQKGLPDGSLGVELRFVSLTRGDWAAVRLRQDTPLPVYTSRQVGNVLPTVGQNVRLTVNNRSIPARVQGQITSFPGLEPEQRRNVVLADQRRMAALLSYGLPIEVTPNELRLALQPDAAYDARSLMFTPDTVTKASAQEAQAADPLSSGVQVVLLLGAACTGLLSMLGIVIHAALTIRSRRVEWAVLRAIGVSARQLTMLIAAEQGLVLLGGTLAGTLVGLMLATVTQPFVQIVTRSGSNGSFVFDWIGLLMLVAGLVLAALLTVGILLLSVQRRGSLAALRLGEEV